MAYSRIPLLPAAPQELTVKLAGINYKLALLYRNMPEAGWILDIRDDGDNSLVLGLSLVTGLDLLAQYKHLGIKGELFILTDGDLFKVPAFDDLGVTSFLYFWTEDAT